MRFGVNAGPANLDKLIKAGADFIECTVVGLNAVTDEELEAFSREIKNGPVCCETLAVMFPGGEIPLTGENVDLRAVATYTKNTLTRLTRYLPLTTIVLGSAGARKLQGDFEYERAMSQMAEAGKAIAGIAETFGIVIGLEPLNSGECNFINSLAEAAQIVREVSHPNLKITADIRHMLIDGEPADAILACEGLIAHTHMATKESKCPQTMDKKIIIPYINALKEIGYDGRMSIEASIDNWDEVSGSLALLREWAG